MPDGASAEEVANLYECSDPEGPSVPADLGPALRDAYQRVHLRGLDPLRKAA
jgi:hypothetical protein